MLYPRKTDEHVCDGDLLKSSFATKAESQDSDGQSECSYERLQPDKQGSRAHTRVRRVRKNNWVHELSASDDSLSGRSLESGVSGVA